MTAARTTADVPDAVAEQAHIIADLHAELSAHRRHTKLANALLVDALHALRNGSPHVTDEYIDRILVAARHLP